MPRKEKTELKRPKRAPTAFILFCHDERPKLIKENPSMKFGDVGKHLGQMWQTCDEKQKKKYNEKALKEKKRYEQEVSDYIKAGGSKDDLKKKKKNGGKEKPGKKERKREKDPATPKKPKSAFLFFSRDEREKLKKEQPNLKFPDVGKQMGKRWKEASPAVLSKYKQLAAEAKAQYDIDMKNFKSTKQLASSNSTSISIPVISSASPTNTFPTPTPTPTPTIATPIAVVAVTESTTEPSIVPVEPTTAILTTNATFANKELEMLPLSISAPEDNEESEENDEDDE